MSNTFFTNYPKVQYQLFGTGLNSTLTDISRGIGLISNRFTEEYLNYTYYDIINGDRPDVISHKLYGDSRFYWTFFIVNDHLRNGLNAAWPLSIRQLENKIKAYDRFSVITFKTLDRIEIDNTQDIDIRLIPLDKKYLPYLKIQSLGNVIAKISQYDNFLNQLFIKDINNKLKIQEFIKKEDIKYKIYWDENNTNLSLKEEWYTKLFNNIREIDISGFNNFLIAYGLDVTTKFTLLDKINYVSPKNIIPALPKFRWPLASTATAKYVYNDKELSFYDIQENQRYYPGYDEYSYAKVEEDKNDKLSRIRVIRPDVIYDFEEKYFELLRDE